jgi:hypothetical protein
MSKIKAKDLLKLGFKKEKDASFGKNFHYYVYEINKHCMLISCSNDEKFKGGYDVEFYEISEVKFTELKELKKLLKLFKSAIKTNA